MYIYLSLRVATINLTFASMLTSWQANMVNIANRIQSAFQGFVEVANHKE
jgi:hypothetical protein